MAAEAESLHAPPLWGALHTTAISFPALQPLQALFLKTSDSVPLPIYQVLPEAPTRISTE